MTLSIPGTCDIDHSSKNSVISAGSRALNNQTQSGFFHKGVDVSYSSCVAVNWNNIKYFSWCCFYFLFTLLILEWKDDLTNETRTWRSCFFIDKVRSPFRLASFMYLLFNSITSLMIREWYDLKLTILFTFFSVASYQQWLGVLETQTFLEAYYTYRHLYRKCLKTCMLRSISRVFCYCCYRMKERLCGI